MMAVTFLVNPFRIIQSVCSDLLAIETLFGLNIVVLAFSSNLKVDECIKVWI